MAISATSLQPLNGSRTELIAFPVHPVNGVTFLNSEGPAMITERPQEGGIFVSF